MRTKRSLLVVLVFGVLLLAGGLAQAGNRTQPLILGRGAGEEVINGGGSISSRLPISEISNAPDHASEMDPAVAYDSSQNRYLAVWTRFNSDGTSVIYGQGVNPGGSLNGIRIPISSATGYNQYADVAYNSALSQYLVIYEVAGAGIYGQILTNAGSPVGAQFCIADSTGGTPQRPAVAYCSATGEYLVTWQRVKEASKGIEARTVSGDGTTLGSVIEVTGLLTIVEPAEPDVAYDSAVDQCLVVWQQLASVVDTHHDIFGQAIHMTGGAHKEGSSVPIHDSADDEVNPAIGALPTPASAGGRYLVVCQRWYDGTTSRIDGWLVNGSDLARPFLVLLSALTGYVPAVAGNENTQEFLSAWVLDNYTLQACTVPSEGSAMSCGLLSGVYLSRPAIAGGPLGDYLVAFHDSLTSVYPQDVFGWLWGDRAFLPLVVKNN